MKQIKQWKHNLNNYQFFLRMYTKDLFSSTYNVFQKISLFIIYWCCYNWISGAEVGKLWSFGKLDKSLHPHHICSFSILYVNLVNIDNTTQSIIQNIRELKAPNLFLKKTGNYFVRTEYYFRTKTYQRSIIPYINKHG